MKYRRLAIHVMSCVAALGIWHWMFSRIRPYKHYISFLFKGDQLPAMIFAFVWYHTVIEHQDQASLLAEQPDTCWFDSTGSDDSWQG